MELVTFGIDENHSLVITFPIFIKPRHTEPFVLYEIETVDVPVEDMNPSLNSFTRVQVTRPYLAANAHHYIQLQIQELHMCKVIQKDYFVKNCLWLSMQPCTPVKVLCSMIEINQ